MDRLLGQFNRRAGARRDVNSDEAIKALMAATPDSEQLSEIQSTAEDEELYGLKELWPDELKGYDTDIECVACFRSTVFSRLY